MSYPKFCPRCRSSSVLLEADEESCFLCGWSRYVSAGMDFPLSSKSSERIATLSPIAPESVKDGGARSRYRIIDPNV